MGRSRCGPSKFNNVIEILTMRSGRKDTYQRRDPLAQQVEDQLKYEDSWARCDAGRIGGYSGDAWRTPDYSHLSDAELIAQYYERKRLEDAYGDGR